MGIKMKKLIVFKIFILLSFSFFSNPMFSEAGGLILFSLRFPKAIEKMPSIRVYHGGKIIVPKVENNFIWFAINVDSIFSPANLLVTEMLDAPKINLTTNLCVPAKSRHCLYTFTCIFRTQMLEGEKKEVAQWSIDKNESDSESFEVDSATIVMMLDPSFIDSFYELDSLQFNGVIAKLPEIKINSSLTDSILEDSQNRMRLSSIDIDAIHSYFQEEIKFTQLGWSICRQFQQTRL